MYVDYLAIDCVEYQIIVNNQVTVAQTQKLYFSGNPTKIWIC